VRDGFIHNVKNAFRIVSPQKPILLIASTVQEKREWFMMIQQAIQQQIENRTRWINENIASLESIHETARLSRYCGRYIPPKKHELQRVQAGKSIIKQSKLLNPDVKYEIEAFDRPQPCKLCQRPIKKFTRTAKCPWCLDTVCKDCINRKVALPTNTKPVTMKVCDGCFGTINYWISEINHTEPEFSQTANNISTANNLNFSLVLNPNSITNMNRSFTNNNDIGSTTEQNIFPITSQSITNRHKTQLHQ